MRKIAGLTILLGVACGGSQYPTKPYGYFDPSPLPATLADATAGAGRVCDTGKDCAGGLVCTNLLSVEVTQCEMPSSDRTCPPDFMLLLAATASVGGAMHPEDYFCVRRCKTGADCAHGQCCLGGNPAVQSCVFDYPPRWPNTPLLCGG